MELDGAMLMLHHLAEERIGAGSRRRQHAENAKWMQTLAAGRSLGDGAG